jgi:hypothetical protein
MRKSLTCSPHCYHQSTSTCSSYGHRLRRAHSQRRKVLEVHVLAVELLFLLCSLCVVQQVHSFQPRSAHVNTPTTHKFSHSSLQEVQEAPTDDNTHNTSNKKPRLHPVLTDLCLTKHQKEKGGVTAIAVLQQLLETNGVTEEAVRAAYQTAESNRKLREDSNLPLMKETPAPGPPSYRTRHIALRVYYDGSKYTGLAENIGLAADQSVEKEVFKALRKAKLIDSDSRATSDYSRCGRTDKGVSAVGQVMALQLKSAFHEQASWDEEGTKLVETKDLVNNSRDTLTVWAPQRKHKDDSTGTIVRQQKELSEYAFELLLNNFLPDDIRILGKSSPVPEPTV